MSEVLIVDDERPVRELLAKWLGPLGYTLNQAPDPVAALEVLAAKPIGVVLIDKDMPGDHNGLWLVEQIQKGHHAVAMLLATGDDAIPPRISMSRGIQGYLVKPFKKDLVLQSVSDAMAWHTVAAKQPRPDPNAPDPIDSWLQGRAGRPPKTE